MATSIKRAPPPPKKVKLWNPTAACNWSILFTPAFGAYLHAENWKALGQPMMVRANRVFFWTTAIGTLFDVIGWFFLVTVGFAGFALCLFYLPILLLLLWYFALGRSQILFVKQKLADGYEKRSWENPIGAAFLVPLFHFGISLFLLFNARSEKPQEQQVAHQTGGEVRFERVEQPRVPTPKELAAKGDILGLIAILESSDSSDRFRLDDTIRQLAETKDERAILPIVRKVVVCYPIAQESLKSFGPRAEPTILKELKNATDEEYIRRLVDALGKVGSTAANAKLEALKDHSNVAVAMAAKHALGQIRMRQAVGMDKPKASEIATAPRESRRRVGLVPVDADVDELIQILEGQERIDRFQLDELVQRLGATKDPRAIRPIVRKVADCYPGAQEALKNFGPDAEPILLDELKSATNQEYIRRLADALGEVGSTAAIPLLEPLRNHSYGMAKLAANIGIKKIRERTGANQDLSIRDASVPELIEMLETVDSSQTNEVVKRLGETRDERAVLPIVQKVAVCYPGAQNALKNFGSAAESVLLDELEKATDQEYIRRLADALGEVGTPAAISALEPLRDHPYGMAQIASKWAIDKIKSRDKTKRK